MANLKDIGYGIGKYLVASDASSLPDIATNRKNLDLLNFKVATNNAYSLYNFKDGMIDAYQTEDGVDTSTSTGTSYNSTDKTFKPTTVAAATTAFTTVASTSWIAPAGVTSVTYLVIAGGGGGGAAQGFDYGGGGGGAGGLRTGTHSVTGGNSYTVVVGGGGAGSTTPSGTGTVGGVSQFDTINASGGGPGAGGTAPGTPGGSGGGSSGGGSNAGAIGPGNVGGYTPVEGYDGAANFPVAPYQAGGGGGSGGVGLSGAPRRPADYGGGTGGPGRDLSATFGTTYGVSGVFAGGGGGGYNTYNTPTPNTAGPGGSGGGGPSSNAGPGTQTGTPGTVNTGSGGGGGSTANTAGYGGNGGSGIVLIKNAAVQLNMDLRSNAQTAQAAPDEGRLVLYEEDIDAITLDTDIKGYVSRDGGTTYTQTPLVQDEAVIGRSSGIDQYTKLLLHCDGANTGTTFTDSSILYPGQTAHVVTANGDAQTSTTQKKFGTAAYYATYAGAGYLTIPHSTDFSYGTGDFTIEMWLYATEWNGYPNIYNNASANCSVYYNTNSGQIVMTTGSTDYGFTWNAGGGSPMDGKITNEWFHLAFTRASNSLRLFINGAQIGSTVTAASNINATSTLYFGSHPGIGDFWRGYMDEIRLSKGIARWTSNFTVPNIMYGNPHRMLSGSVDIAGQPAGTDMKYKVETLNNKNLKLHGASLLWA